MCVGVFVGGDLSVRLCLACYACAWVCVCRRNNLLGWGGVELNECGVESSVTITICHSCVCAHYTFSCSPSTPMCRTVKAVVLEGKYWKRNKDAVAREYRKWRSYYYKQRIQKLVRANISTHHW